MAIIVAGAFREYGRDNLLDIFRWGLVAVDLVQRQLSAAAWMNALKHGLMEYQIVLCDETPEDIENVVGEIITALKPRGSVEAQLAEHIAVCA